MRKTIAVVAALSLGLVAGPALAACADNPRIDWKVAGGFALFNKTEAGRQAGDALLDDLAAANAGSTTVSMEKAYETAIRHLVKTDLPDGGLYKATFYNRSSETYGDDKKALLKPDYRRIWIQMPSQAGDCVWRTGETVSAPRACAEATALEVKPDTDVDVTAEIAGGPPVTTCVKVEDTLILAMGDSFAAGEGNPDRPTKWSELTAEGRAAKRGGIDWWSSLKLRPSGSADWWDNTCHRSLLSQHALAALSLAAQDRRRSVTFVSFACSGATMLDGFVAPRTSAPGGPRHKGGEWDSIAYRESQINQAVDLLCEVKGQEQKLAIPQGLTYWNQLSSHTLKKAGQGLKEVVVQTCSTWWRRPDVVLNTLGGNDIGFAGVAAWAVMPANGRTPGSVFFLANSELEKSRNPNMGLVCPLKVPGQWRCQTIASQWNPFTWDYAPSAEELALIDLPAMLDLGARAFNLSGLGAKAKVKIHTLYPSILRDEAGRLCGERWTKLPGVRTIPAKDEGLRMQREPWLAQYTRVPSFFQPDPWSFGIANAPDGKDCLYGVPDNIAYYSACVLEKRAWANLNRNVGEVMARSGWTVVDQAPVTARHGVCASDGLGQTYEKEFGWPRWIAGGWDRDYPAPTDWNAYAPRSGRWFRTANDAALTQYVVFKGKEGRGEAVSGTIHPTAQAHAVMADQIVRAAGDLHAPVHAD